ncbi:ketopantoate reductase family protein, partial [Streptococcus agalactiae]|nr:ketopantoate reductase family protein [Streptococcus agalactiae]
KYIIGFPTAGGNLKQKKLNCVLFDHIMLESEEKATITNYKELLEFLESADIKVENPYDMIEWIWIHMAINAGVTSTAARAGKIDDPKQLAVNLMRDNHGLSIAVKSIRETIKVVKNRGVDLRLYKNELFPYKIPSTIAGIIMKRMFARNELTSRIMTLHNDVKDIMYGCKCIYDAGKQEKLNLPLFYHNMDKIFNS